MSKVCLMETATSGKTKHIEGQNAAAGKRNNTVIESNTKSPVSTDSYNSATGFPTSFYAEISNDWKIKKYVSAPILNRNDAINKSQLHLIDLIRYYEGDPRNNYKAKSKYDDRNNVRTYGYGITNLSNDLKNKYKLSIPPKNEQDAYKAMLVYMHEVAKKDVIAVIGQEIYDNAPQSIKEALLDLAFNKGRPALKEAKGLKEAIKKQEWSKVLPLLVYTKARTKNNTSKEENAGLYRRSLSRVILAARDLPKSESINNKVKSLYTEAKNCAISQKEQPKTIEEFDKIYQAYTKGPLSINEEQSSNTKSDGTKSYRVNQAQMGVFSIAKSLRPDKSGVNDTKGLLIAIMQKIVELNNIASDGEDENGYPKTAMQKQGAVLKLPTSIVFEGKTIELNAPTEMEDVTPTIPKPESQKEDVKPSQKSEEKVDTLSVSEEVQEAKEESSSSSSWWKTALSGAVGGTLGIIAGKLLKTNNLALKMLGILGIGLGIGLYKLINHSKNNIVDDFDPSDPNTTQFQRLIHEKDVKITEINKHKITLPNGKEEEIALQIVEKQYTVQPYTPENPETVWGIAKRYGMSRRELGEYNDLQLSVRDSVEDYHNINAGQILTIKRVGYKVEKGDTLEGIAEKFGITKEILVDANNIYEEDGYELKEKTILELPALVHKIQSGETLGGIAQKYGTTIDVLKRINNLSDDKIIAGKELIVIYTKDPDQKIVSSKTEDGKKIEKAKLYITPDLQNRPELQEKTIVNGNIVATRAVFEDKNIKGPLSGHTIILDAGHGYKRSGGTDCGAIAPGIEQEWLLNYDNVKRLRKKLVEQGAKVIYLQGQRGLIEDAMKEAKNKGDLFISIHANTANKPKDRTQIYYRDLGVNGKAKVDSKKFADLVAKNFNIKYKNNEYTRNGKPVYAESLIGQDGTLNGKTIKEARTGMLKSIINSTRIPSVIWEVGFMDSPTGRKRLKDPNTMNDYANVVCQSIVEFLKSES